MRKRTLAVLLSAAMIACSITGCGGNSGKETEGTTAQQEEAAGKKTENKEAEAAKTEAGGDGGITGKTEFANDKLLNLDLSIIQGYEESAKNVTGIDVTIVTSPDVAAYKTSIQQSIHDKSAPGLFTWWGGYQLQTLVDNGLVEDLTDLWKDYITPAGVSADIADAFTYDGKIYAAPYSILYNVILYNK